MAMNSIFSESPYPIVHYPTTASTDYSTSAARSAYSDVSPDFYPTYQTATAHVGSAVSPLESQLANYAQPYTTYYPHYQQSQVHTLSSPMSPTVSVLPEPHSKDQGSPPLTDGKDGPTYDWMKIRRNPPKTTRKFTIVLNITNTIMTTFTVLVISIDCL